ncbi:hypothetical protein QE152_g7087 [Popillia japonica]|uniref:Reverse transcriptase n=1 Tax=Popillia japonica TaxID=7064 RepID=A0AAW1MCL0_POPJA
MLRHEAGVSLNRGYVSEKFGRQQKNDLLRILPALSYVTYSDDIKLYAELFFDNDAIFLQENLNKLFANIRW